jgi:hypothetical protein
MEEEPIVLYCVIRVTFRCRMSGRHFILCSCRFSEAFVLSLLTLATL